MTQRETLQADASHHAAAIARWDDEGGAFASLLSKTDAAALKTERSRQMGAVPTSLKFDPALAGDEHILECLGAAVIMRWGTLPTKIQRELFEDATSLADLAQTAQLKGQIARYLHNRKDDLRAIKTMPRQAAT